MLESLLMSNLTFILFFAILTSIGWVATDIYLPSLPAMTAYFNTSITLTQFTLPAYMISISISPLFAGPYSDMVGRKKVLCAGLALSLLATVGCIFSWNIYVLIIARFIQGIGFGAVVATARAMLPDRYQGADMARMSSINGSVTPIFLTVSPLLGGFIEEQSSWQFVFVFMFCYTALMLIAIWKFMDETNTQPRQLTIQEVIGVYKLLMKNKGLLRYGTLPAFVIAGAGSYITVSPYLFQKVLGLSPSEYGMVAVLTGSMIMLSGVINSHLMERFRLRSIIYCGASLICLSSALLFLIHFTHQVTTLNLILICMIFFLNINLIMPNTYSLAFQYIDKHYGTAMAILNTILMIGITSASSIAALLPENDVVPLASMFAVSGGLIFIGLLSTRVMD